MQYRKSFYHFLFFWLLLLGMDSAFARGSSSDGGATESKDGDESQAAQEAEPPSIFDEIEVRGRAGDLVGIAQSASEGSTGRDALEGRPILRPGDLVETVPGLVATQHSGDGKANQYFLRGFNLDHGTDFSIAVDGMPVNMPSHGHGQGYADLSFLIPELVEEVGFTRGISSSLTGDFSAAGSARIALVDRLDRSFVELTAGSYDFNRLVAGHSTALGDGSLTAAVEVHRNDGPWQRPNDSERFNGILRFVVGDASRGWSLTAMGYDGSWLSTDQIPKRAVDQGLIDRFGLLDPGPRGSTRRHSLSGEYRRSDDRSLTLVSAYALRYDFRLISNFTYFLEDPDLGDQFEQRDERWTTGFDLRHRHYATLGSRPVEWVVGLQGRFDDITNGLFRTSDLERLGTVRRDAIEQWGVGPYGELTVRWNDTFRAILGLRADRYDAAVASDLGANSGTADSTLVSPKLALVFGPWNRTELYTSWGFGFHSNDARGATIRVDPVSGETAEAVSPLVRAEGIEIGVRTSALSGLQSTLTIHRLDLDSELVFVGDGGATEASRPSRRTGVEWTNAWQVNPWLQLDLDLAWVDAEFTDRDPSGSEIPGALDSVVTGGFLIGRGPWSGAMRVRATSDYPLTEDASVRSGASTIVNARIAFASSARWEIALEAFNLLDRKESDIEYFYASRLPGEPAGGIEDVHFHPVERRTARLTLAWKF